MTERISREQERALAARLKHEAEAMRPEFSESLHARICEAIRQGEARTPPVPVPAWRQRRWISAVAAAACVLGVSLAARQWIGPSAPQPRPVGPVVEETDLPEVPDPLQELSEVTVEPRRKVELVGLMVDSNLTVDQWASLNHDARLATRMLIDQLPFDVTGAREN